MTPRGGSPERSSPPEPTDPADPPGPPGPPAPPDPIDRWFWPVFAALLAAAAALPLAYRYLPLLDWPEHCAQAALAAHLDEPAWRFGEYYRGTGWFLPYQGLRLLQVGLGRLLGDGLGARAALVPYLVGLPLAVAALARRCGRDRWVALGAFTLLVEGNLWWGMVPYACGIALLLAGAVLAIDFLERGGRARAALLSALGVALFFTHPQATALSGGVAAALALAGRRRGDREARPLLLVATALPGQVLLLGYMIGGGWISGEAVSDLAAAGGARWYPPWTMAWTLPWTTGLRDAGDGPAWAYLLALAAVGMGALTQRLGAAGRPAERGWPAAGLATWAVFAVLLFAAPAKWRGEAIAGRLASTVALGALWLLPMRAPDGRRRSSALGPARIGLALAAAAALALVHQRFASYHRALAPLDRIIAAVPVGSRVATLIYEPFPERLELPCHLHLGGYVHAARGGLASSSFTRLGYTYCDEVPREALIPDLWAAARRGEVLAGAAARYYDFVLVRRGPRYPGRPWAPDAAVRGTRLVDEGGFELWRRDR